MAVSNDGWEDVPTTTSNDGWEDVPANDTITDRVQSSPMSKEELDKFLLDNPDLAGYDTYKRDPNAGRGANPTGVQDVNPTIGFESGLPGEYSLKYDDIRKGLAAITAPVIGAWNTMTGPKGNIGNPDQIPYTQAVGESYNKAIEGRGIPGIVSDPVNLTMFIPGVGEVAMSRLAGMGGKAAKAGEFLASHPVITKGAGSAIEGAGYTGASEALDPTKEFTGRDLAIAGGLGGVLGAGGGFLQQWGKESFPGIMTGNARSIDAPTKARLAEHLDEILGAGFTPKNRRGFEQLSDKETAILGQAYNKGIEKATPFSYSKGADNSKLYLQKAREDLDRINATGELYEGERQSVENIIRSKGAVGPSVESPTEAYHIYGLRSGDQVPSPMLPSGTEEPALFTLGDIRSEVEQRYKDKLAASDILSDKNMKKLDKAQESALRSVRHRQEIEPVIKNYLNLPENASTETMVKSLKEYAESNPDEAAKLYDMWNNPVYEAREVSTLRNNMNDPTMYRDPTKSGETQMARRHLATSYRDAINDMLGADPRYAAHVTPEVRARYGLYKALGDVVDAPGSLKLSDRIMGLAVDNWLRASTLYKAGGLVDKLRKLGPATISNREKK